MVPVAVQCRTLCKVSWSNGAESLLVKVATRQAKLRRARIGKLLEMRAGPRTYSFAIGEENGVRSGLRHSAPHVEEENAVGLRQNPNASACIHMHRAWETQGPPHSRSSFSTIISPLCPSSSLTNMALLELFKSQPRNLGLDKNTLGIRTAFLGVVFTYVLYRVIQGWRRRAVGERPLYIWSKGLIRVA